MFVLDALNFCFWPTTWEYDNLALSIKNAYDKDPNNIKPKFLATISFKDFKNLFFSEEASNFPQLEERHRVINELGYKTMKYFDGDFSNILKKADFDASEILELLSNTFLLFQDHCIYDGRQVFFYKRAQILIADLYAAFKEKGFEFQIKKIERLTCFADYRVPQILAEEGVLEYSNELMEFIKEKKIMDYGCKLEVELRAAMIQAVCLISKNLTNKSEVEVDWL